MNGCVVWFTGLPASGKSTLAAGVRDALLARGVATVILDSDELRGALVPAHGYDQSGRAAFYETLARLSALLARQRLVVLVAATANLRAHREAARALAPRFLEVHVATPLDECARRDPKGLYASATESGSNTLPGAGATYEPPIHPDVQASGGYDREAIAQLIDLLGDAATRPAAS